MKLRILRKTVTVMDKSKPARYGERDFPTVKKHVDKLQYTDKHGDWQDVPIVEGAGE